MSMLKQGVPHTYLGWPSLERMLREGSVGSGRVTHLVSVEKIDDMPECDEIRSRIDSPFDTRPNWAVVERHVTDDGYVGRITRVVATDQYFTHFELHLAARNWMLCQAYPMDFAPQSCETCDTGRGDFGWLGKYRATWQRRLAGPSRRPNK